MITIAQLTHFCVAATAKGDLFPIGKLILWGIYEIPENSNNLDTRKMEAIEILKFYCPKMEMERQKF